MEIIKDSELLENDYEIIFELYPGEVIELEHKEGGKIQCIVVGFSSGMLKLRVYLEIV